MNKDVKEGLKQIKKGLKDEAKDVVDKFDVNNDGRVELSEISNVLSDDAKKAFAKASSFAKESNISEKVKDDVVPKIEALKMEAEIKAEKIGAEIQHRKDIREKKEEL